MARSVRDNTWFSFGGFTADLCTAELRAFGQRIPLPEKSFRALALLLDQAGDMVSREDLFRKLWPAGIHVNFHHSLNCIIATLRRTLADSPKNPRFIETVGSHGYRFIGTATVGKGGEGEQRNTSGTRFRIAVLPFRSLCSRSSGTSWFCEGFAAELIVWLGHILAPHVGIIARSSTLKYRGTTKSLSQIGRELRVEYVLEGSVHCTSDKISITMELVNTRNLEHVWIERYDYHADDLLIIQREVPGKIARTLAKHFFASRPNDFRRYIPRPEASTSCMRGLYYQASWKEEDLRNSVKCFERAIHEDPGYSSAYTGLSTSLMFLGSHGLEERSPRVFVRQAKEAAMKALELNNTLSYPYAALARIKYLHELDWPAAEELLRQAIKLNSNDAAPHWLLSYYLSSKGRHEEAVAESLEAREIDPLSLLAKVSLGTARYFARQYEEAIAIFKGILELEPTFWVALMWLGATYRQGYLYQEAITALEKARQNCRGSSTVLAWLGEVYAKAGMKEEAWGVISTLESMSRLRYVSALDFTLLYTGLKRNSEAWKWLGRAYRERSLLLPVLLPTDPRFDSLRTDPEFHKLTDLIVCAGGA